MLEVKVIDYGKLSNLYNICNAIEFMGFRYSIVKEAKEIDEAACLILPGVGAFEDGISGLRSKGLDKAIIDYAKRGKPLLGICLGMQLLMEASYEFGKHKGLNLIEGEARKFQSDKHYKVPNINWHPVKFKNTNAEDKYYYFVHSYYIITQYADNTCGTTNYSNVTFASAVHKENVWGVQFHPERSGKNGLHLLHNFITKHKLYE